MSIQPGQTPRVLRLPRDSAGRIAALARAAYPAEACGVLIGRYSVRGVEVARVGRGRNIDAAPTRRYELAPRDFLRWDRAAAGRGLEVVGIWHSHPDAEPVPSPADRRDAWRGWSYLIVGAWATGSVEVRSWRLEGEAFVEEEVEWWRP